MKKEKPSKKPLPDSKQDTPAESVPDEDTEALQDEKFKVLQDNSSATLPDDNSGPVSDTPDTPPEYDPYSGMFSDNPYDLSTGELIKEEKKPEPPKIDERKENAKKIVPLMIMLAVTVPFFIIALYCMDNYIRIFPEVDQPVPKRVQITLLILICMVMVLAGYLLIRRNNVQVTSHFQKRIDGRILKYLLPFSVLLLLSLFLPGGFLVGNIICGALMLSAVPFVVLVFGRLPQRTRRIFGPVMAVMLVICAGINFYLKLIMRAADISCEYIIITNRPEAELPRGLKDTYFISTELLPGDYGYESDYIENYERYRYIADKSIKDTDIDRLIYNSDGNPNVPAGDLDDRLTALLDELSEHYNEEFFERYDLMLRPVPYFASLNSITVSKFRYCGGLAYFTETLDYESKPNKYLGEYVDLCYQLIAFPKDIHGRQLAEGGIQYNESVRGRPL